MKLLLITLLAFSSLAEDPNKKSNQKDPTKEKLVVTDVKKSEIEGAIKSDAEFLKCKEIKNDPQAQSDCITNMVSGMNPKQLEAIQKDLGESSFKVEGGKRSEAIKEFMQARISKLIYGDKKDEDKTKPPKVVGHGAYREIYKSQLGKNMLLDINTYCLENIGSDEVSSILDAKLVGGNYSYGFSKVSTDGDVIKFSDDGVSDFKDLIGQIYEYTRGNQDVSKETRETKTLTLLKKASFKEYKNGLGDEAGKFCRNTIIPSMCELYKCNSTKEEDLEGSVTTEGSEKYICKNKYNYTAQIPSKNGQIACTLVKKLESYKKVFKGLKNQKEFFDKDADSLRFAGSTENIETAYDKIDEITSVGSKELTNEVEALKNIDETTKEIEDTCIQSQDMDSDLCKGLASTMSGDDTDAVIYESDLANAVYKQKVKLAADAGPEELKKFLEENNLMAKYGSKIDKLKPEELAKIIANDYKSKKDSLRDTMMKKLKALKGTSSGQGVNEIVDDGETIGNKKKKLENDKEYIETMFEYNNIVTSYLSLSKKGEKEDGSDREVVGSFGQNKKSELASLEKYKGSMNEQEQLEYEEYKKMFSDDGSSGTSSTKNSMDSVDFIGFLDYVLDTPKPETK